MARALREGREGAPTHGARMRGSSFARSAERSAASLRRARVWPPIIEAMAGREQRLLGVWLTLRALRAAGSAHDLVIPASRGSWSQPVRAWARGG